MKLEINLLGPNGAGKSTLISLLVRNRIPAAGEISRNDKEIGKEGAAYRSIIGYKPQQQSLYPKFRVEKFLYYMANLKGIPGRKPSISADDLLRFP